jgi:hypothetical protein
MMPFPNRRGPAAVVLIVAALLGFGSCLGGSEPGLDFTAPPPTGGRPPQRPPAGGSGTPTAAAPRSGARVPGTAGEFDRAACSVVSPDELLAALAEPYNILSGQVLKQDGPPSPGAGHTSDDRDGIGCGFRFAGTDTSDGDVFHGVVIRVTRWQTSGPRRMAECQAAARVAAASPPPRYRMLDLRDESCLGPGPAVTIRAGTSYYSVAVLVNPHMADARDEDVATGPLALAAAGLTADRLPAR